MNLITIKSEKFITNVTSQELGNLGECALTVDPNVQPKALPFRKLPLAVKIDVKKEIDNLVNLGILVPVKQPTKRVSQMDVPRKSNGEIRVCIDPQVVNKALMREYYRLPTFDDILPKLNAARTFIKFDVKKSLLTCKTWRKIKSSDHNNDTLRSFQTDKATIRTQGF